MSFRIEGYADLQVSEYLDDCTVGHVPLKCKVGFEDELE
jgi:hypothetical protein